MPRILTYNVHRFVGTDRKTSPGRTAEVIAACEPDIVALQEARVGRGRTYAAAVARYLGMALTFEPTFSVLGERFGLAVLTALPCRTVKTGRLPTLSGTSLVRKALWVEIEVGGARLQLVNTHLGLFSRRERLLQAETLMGEEWLGRAGCARPAILVGDLNAGSRSHAYRRFADEFDDVQLATTLPLQATFHTRLPVRRIDHIFVSPSIEVIDAEAIRSPLARVASDHLPLVADLRLPGEAFGPGRPSRAPVMERVAA
jgi:endonuclease/exonuclease/phosphatase family metal-dependent hydrolase